MKTIWTWTQVTFTGIGGFLGWFLGGLDGFIYALIAFVVVDYITGVMCAVLEKKLSSEVGARGIFKKVLIFLLVGIGHLADVYLLGDGNALRTAVIFFYISNEGISLLENAAIIGLPVPEKLKNALAQLKNKEEGDHKMNLKKLIFTNNACYKAGKTITVKGIMVHSTGASNPNLKRYVGPDDGLLGKNTGNNHWNQDKPDGRQVCVHGFIGKLADGSIATYQTLPWNHRGWHAGGAANDTHIGFEICEDNLTDKDYFRKVFNEAAELCAMLCKQYGLTEKNIICHSEGYKQGIASNHSDVMHWFPKHGESMDTFRVAVKKLLAAETPTQNQTQSGKLYRVQVGAYSVKSNADNMLAKLKKAGFDGYIKYD